MVIIFASERAREYLLEHGIVYTVRLKKRYQVGDDWMTDKRLGSKIKDVFVTYMGETTVTLLQPYVKQSGFKDLNDWWAEIVNLNKVGVRLDTLHLYKVELRGES